MTPNQVPSSHLNLAHTIWLDLSDGSTLGVPLAWFPRLLNASPEERQAFEISAFGLHWKALDEYLSVAGLLADRGDQTNPLPMGEGSPP